MLTFAVATCATAGCSAADVTDPAVAAPATVTATAPATATATAGTLTKARPTAVAVPSIAVRTDRLIDLGLTPSGEMEVPADAVTAGWLTLGPTPGELGPAVIAAHVDYEGVPGVFDRLHEVEPGDEIAVTRADGTVAAFSAYRVARFTKSRFPTEEVYGDTTAPELRLITCGGEFDSATRNYLDNVVVFARLVRGAP